jgi:hypothetical protein|tara:strand:+ start:4993 stop:5388 length:396 start_codon:yes stop_codon:yes gene_type:complete
MKDRIKKSLLPIAGSNIKVLENPKSLEKKKKNRFIQLVNAIKEINRRANELTEEYGINMFYYEDAHYQIMEVLLEELYGCSACKVIFWWVYDAENPKTQNYRIQDEKTGKEYPIKTTTQLYNTIKKLKLFK